MTCALNHPAATALPDSDIKMMRLSRSAIPSSERESIEEG